MQRNTLNFANYHSLNYCSIEYKKPYIAVADWKKINMMEVNNDEKLKEKYCNTKIKEGLFINLLGLYNKFIVLDTDDVKAYNFVMNLIKENNLTVVKTKSYSQFNNPSLYYKNHFYFKVPKGANVCSKQHKNDPIYGDLDIIIDVVEHITSCIDNDNISEISEEILKNLQAIRKEEEIEKKEEIIEETSDEEEEKIKELLDLLDTKRANNYEDWRNVGFILKTIDETFFDLFNEFSKRSPNYKNTADIRKHWKTYKKDGDNLLGIGSLIKMAKEDNPDEFKKWAEKWKPKNNVVNDDYKIMKDELEKKLFMIEEPVCYGWTNDEGNISFKKLSDISQILKPYKIGKKSFFELWLEDIDKRKYTKVDFIPKLDYNGKAYNMFSGFKNNNDKPINNDKIKPFFDYLDRIFKNEVISISAILDWIAWIRQRPHLKTEKAIVLYSDTQGVGKNTLVEIIGAVLGYTTTVNDVKDLVKNFNNHITNKLIIYGDEVKVKAKELRDDLKTMITRTKMQCEKKGIDSYEINDYSNYIFTTNNQNSFYIEPTDRRFMLFDLVEEKMSEKESKTLRTLMQDNEFLESLDTYFKTRELPERLEAPMNKYKKLLIALSAPAYIQMIYTQPFKFAGNEWRSSDLYEVAITYAKGHFLESTFSKDKMARDLKNEFEPFFTRNSINRFYKFPDEKQFIEYLKSKRPELLIDY